MLLARRKVGPLRKAAPRLLRAISSNSRRTLGDAGRGFVERVANGLAERHRRDRNRAADNRQDQRILGRRSTRLVLQHVDESLHGHIPSLKGSRASLPGTSSPLRDGRRNANAHSPSRLPDWNRESFGSRRSPPSAQLTKGCARVNTLSTIVF